MSWMSRASCVPFGIKTPARSVSSVAIRGIAPDAELSLRIFCGDRGISEQGIDGALSLVVFIPP
jgi:hypothetical protein